MANAQMTTTQLCSREVFSDEKHRVLRLIAPIALLSRAVHHTNNATETHPSFACVVVLQNTYSRKASRA